MVRLQEFRRGRRLVVELRNLPIALRVVIVCVDDYLAGQRLDGNAADVLEWDSHHDDFAILRRLDRRCCAGPGAELVYERRERLGVPRIADHHGVAVRHREARDLASDAARADESNRHHEQNMPWIVGVQWELPGLWRVE